MVQGVHGSAVGRWRHISIYLANQSGGSSGTWFKTFRVLGKVDGGTHTTHPDDLYEVGYLFLMHYLFKLIAFRLIIMMIINYLCAIHVYERFPKKRKTNKYRVLDVEFKCYNLMSSFF